MNSRYNELFAVPPEGSYYRASAVELSNFLSPGCPAYAFFYLFSATFFRHLLYQTNLKYTNLFLNY